MAVKTLPLPGHEPAPVPAPLIERGPARAAAPGTSLPSLRGLTVTGLLAVVAVIVGAMMGGREFIRHSPGAWFFGTPGGFLGSLHRGGPPGALSLILLYGGLLVLLAAWVRLLQVVAARPGQPLRRVLGVIAVWLAPVLISPPLFSNDVYSYAGQAELVSHHINPYDYGTAVLGPGTPFNTLPGPVWAHTGSPYGPLILRIDGFMVSLGHHQILVILVLLRLLALAALAVVVAALVALARDHGRDPATAVALVAASPLAVLTLIGGAHNDVVVAAMVLTGLLVARRRSWVLGIVICAAAVTVKVPALLAVGFLGWNWAPPGADWRLRLRRLLLAGGLGLVVVVAVSELTGLGMGWLHTLNTSSRVSTGVTPVATMAHLLAWPGQLLGLHPPFDRFLSACRALGMLVAAAVALWQLLRSPRVGLMASLGTSLAVLALLGPTVWPWYLVWGIAVLATAHTPRIRRVVVALTVVATMLGAAPNKDIWLTLVRAPLSEDVLVLGSLVLVALVCGRWLLRHAPSADLSQRVPEHGRPLLGVV